VAVCFYVVKGFYSFRCTIGVENTSCVFLISISNIAQLVESNVDFITFK